jgi:hypothetical protein
MSGLEFTKEAAKQLEKIYLTRDVGGAAAGDNSPAQFIQW